jgi:hypothetical protein
MDSLGNPHSVWGLSNPGQYNDLSSPITYGHYGNGDFTIPPGPPLVAGRTYLVTLIAWDKPNGVPLFTGTGSFVH